MLVVGGGITGLTAAYLLSKAGRSVALLERERLGSVDTGHTTAHVTAVTDSRLTALEARFGRDHAQAVWDAGFAAIARSMRSSGTSRSLVNSVGVRANVSSADEADGAVDIAALQHETSLALDLGFDAAFVDDVPCVHRPGIRFDHQAKFHPRKYLAGLARAVIGLGGLLFEHSPVDELTEQPLGAKANGCRITAGYVVIATHSPLWGNTPDSRATWLQTNLALYSSYAVAGRVPKGAAPEALWWSTADQYAYLRVDAHRGYDLVVYGGEDHKTGQKTDAAERYDRLTHALIGLFPSVKVTHRWSGQVIETSDGLPVLGETSDRQFVATGFSGNGMTFGTLGAMMATDRVMGRTTPGRTCLLRIGLSCELACGTTCWKTRTIPTIDCAIGLPAPPLDPCGRFDVATVPSSNYRAEGRRFPRRDRGHHPSICRVQSSRVPCRLERSRAHMGLPVPWLSLHGQRRRSVRSRANWSQSI